MTLLMSMYTLGRWACLLKKASLRLALKMLSLRAAVKHLSGFCGTVDASFGQSYVIKRRFVEKAFTRKLFEVHIERQNPWGNKKTHYEDYDAVVVTDFGHGFVTPQMIHEMCATSRFLAVNAQTNSANRGFNLITKYPRADYVVIDGLEARLAAHDRDSSIEEVIRVLGYDRMVVTLGSEGAVGYYHDEFTYSKAVTNKVVDTMGAGDAFFCVTAPLAAAGADMETLLAVGNAAGAIKCGSVGQIAVDRESLCRTIAG
jgi:bifunctional ADP-heptose synthase (sugar kinase/adenylyltransferase)